MDFLRFLETNNLKQVEVADYLGVSKSAISNIVLSKSKPSKENLQKLINNPFGWDTTMLTGEKGINVHTEGDRSSVNINSHNTTNGVDGELLTLREKIASLSAQLEVKNEQIADLRSQIELLSKLLLK